MAKSSSIQKNLFRSKLIEKHSIKRKFLKNKINLKIKIVSVGPDRTQTIFV